jgi:hypothetical protein
LPGSFADAPVTPAPTAAYCATQHPDFSKLAARISISNLHKNTTKVFSEAIEVFYTYKHPRNGEPSPAQPSRRLQTLFMPPTDPLQASRPL